MNRTATIIVPRHHVGVRADTVLPLVPIVVTAVATVAAVVVSNGNLAASVAPVLLGAALWFVCVAPLRVTLGLVMFAALAVDRPGDADARWASPLVTVGGLLFHNLNHVIAIDALRFSGVFALLAVLLVVRGYRRLTGRLRDTAGSLLPAAPMPWAATAAVVTIAAAVGFGVLRGGDIQMAKVQVQAFLQLLAVAYLFSVSLRGSRDYRWLATLIVTAAGIKALMALWVRAVLPSAFPDQWGVMRELEYATNHCDSMLFACASAVLLGPLFHRPSRRQVTSCLLLMPLIVAGLVANDRRIAWVQVGLVIAAFLVMNPGSAFTRRVARTAVLLSPLLLVYVGVGWSSPSRLFAPVGFVRNLVQAERSDGSLDRSTLFRDVENFNLVHTFLGNPVLGTGFGHPFTMEVKGDALAEFKEYGYLPHNSLLGLWSFTGFVGVTGILGTLVVALLLAVQAHARAVSSDHAIAAAAVVGCLFSYVIHLWADIGFTEAPTIFLVGLAMAIAGQAAAACSGRPSGMVSAEPHSVPYGISRRPT